MSYYPIFVDLDGKKVLVVGGGRIAQRKAVTLIEFGALIHLVSDDLTSKLKELVEEGEITYLGTRFRDQDLDGAFLVVAATDDTGLNRRISASARGRGILINAVDQPSDCSFIVPSIVKRGNLVIAVSTSGKSPALAKKIRKELERQFGGEYETFLIVMERLRKEILRKGLSQEENSRIFHKIIDSSSFKAVAQGEWDRLESILCQILPEGMVVEDIFKDLVPG
ncbi:MAG: bifunctional precorrin-2 dehydrogenase/sirohydrochlorin ferrochelatase [Thermodesulfobacteriota bacterium]|nr:bifunctional precorrin-2 dehydrogenase/sirohydrochlorin ferrochelatase [Thermodesulfobacteriota bacterium]